MSDFLADRAAADKEFYHAYGGAMAGWANVESALGIYVQRITRLDEDMCRALYLSARSFEGRAEMVLSLVPFSRTTPEGRRFLTRAIGIARTYAQTRNRLAHDPHWVMKGGTTERAIHTPKGGKLFKAQIENAWGNFSQLAVILWASQGYQRKLLREPSLSLSLLDQLPADPATKRTAHTNAGSLVAELLRHPL